MCSVPEVEDGEPIYDENDSEDECDASEETEENPEEEKIPELTEANPSINSLKNKSAYFYSKLILFENDRNAKLPTTTTKKLAIMKRIQPRKE